MLGADARPAAAISDLPSVALAAGAVAGMWAAARRRRTARRGRTMLQVRPRPLPLIRDKVVTATQRLPLWKLSDEMYMKRQLAPNPDQSWTEVRRDQARMREMVLDQQKRDMRRIETEIAGQRLAPTHPLGSLRKGMWLDGRISSTRQYGVMVDVGAYTEGGEWIDGHMNLGQFREDGNYVPVDQMMKEVYLGEHVRVRVMECVPATGTLNLSMRSAEDLPDLFLGEPRPYNWFDLTSGMKVTGIIRRVWDKWAIVDIGADRLARLHVRDHKRDTTRYGFIRLGREHKYASSCYFRGAQIDCWIRSTEFNRLSLTMNKPRSIAREAQGPTRKKDNTWLEGGIPKNERMTREQRRDREKAEAEKAPWDPYVPHVDEWLDEAMEPDEETDSWVAKTERELFNQLEDEEDEEEDNSLEEELKGDLSKAKRIYETITDYANERGLGPVQEEEEAEDFAEDFAEDDFADDDFMDGGDMAGNEIGFGPHAFPAAELDGWVLNDDDMGGKEKGADAGPELTDEELDAFFLAEDDDLGLEEGFDDMGDRSGERGWR